MPPLPKSERGVALPPLAQRLATRGSNALIGLWRALTTGGDAGVTRQTVLGQLFITLLPALFVAAVLGTFYQVGTSPKIEASTAGLVEAGGLVAADVKEESTGLIGESDTDEEKSGAEQPGSEAAGALPPPPGAEPGKPAGAKDVRDTAKAADVPTKGAAAAASERLPVPTWLWIVFAVGIAALVVLYWLMSWERLEVFKMLLSSFFPLAIMIIAVLGSIVLGLATPTEAAAVGALGGFVLAGAYRFATHSGAAARGGANSAAAIGRTVRELGGIVKESAFLTAKTSAMVCWLFVGSSIFSAAFALLGGQGVVERWVLSFDMTPVQFMILAQIIIFLLGWPLEWTEIIVIFMPIFIPLLPHFNIDPLFFGILVALNLQTAFLSPPVAMAAFYLKGVAPPHVTLNQIFAGMLPFMGIQVIALILLYVFPAIGLWLPQVLYK